MWKGEKRQIEGEVMVAGSRILIAILSLVLIFDVAVILPAASGASVFELRRPFETAVANSAFNVESLLSDGEVIETPEGATIYLSMGGVGHILLASGTRVKLAAVSVAPGLNREDLNSLLAVEVMSGDLIVKLQPHSGALVQAAGSTFAASRGAAFHANVRDGKAIFDASENVASRYGNWAVKVPRDLLRGEPRGEGEADAEFKAPGRPGRQLLESLRLDLMDKVRPIGAVQSLGAFTINSQLTRNGSLLWGNELIQAPPEASVSAALNNIGQVTLHGGSRGRLMAAMINGDPQRRMLAASLESGAMSVKLQAGVPAFVQSKSSTFVAARGSHFRVRVIDGSPVIDTSGSDVLAIGEWRLTIPSSLSGVNSDKGQTGDPNPPRRYLVRPVGLTSNMVMRARATRQIQVLVTDESDRPIPSLPVIFLLESTGGQNVGTLSDAAVSPAGAKVFTNANGIASVTFRAGDQAASGMISATVEGTDAAWMGHLSLLKVVPGFWSPRNAIPIFATLAAGVAIGVTKAVTKDDR